MVWLGVSRLLIFISSGLCIDAREPNLAIRSFVCEKDGLDVGISVQLFELDILVVRFGKLLHFLCEYSHCCMSNADILTRGKIGHPY